MVVYDWVVLVVSDRSAIIIPRLHHRHVDKVPSLAAMWNEIHQYQSLETGFAHGRSLGGKRESESMDLCRLLLDFYVYC